MFIKSDYHGNGALKLDIVMRIVFGENSIRFYDIDNILFDIWHYKNQLDRNNDYKHNICHVLERYNYCKGIPHL